MIRTVSTVIHISHKEVKELIVTYLNSKGEQSSVDDIELDSTGYLITADSLIARV